MPQGERPPPIWVRLIVAVGVALFVMWAILRGLDQDWRSVLVFGVPAAVGGIVFWFLGHTFYRWYARALFLAAIGATVPPTIRLFKRSAGEEWEFLIDGVPWMIPVAFVYVGYLILRLEERLPSKPARSIGSELDRFIRALRSALTDGIAPEEVRSGDVISTLSSTANALLDSDNSWEADQRKLLEAFGNPSITDAGNEEKWPFTSIARERAEWLLQRLESRRN